MAVIALVTLVIFGMMAAASPLDDNAVRRAKSLVTQLTLEEQLTLVRGYKSPYVGFVPGIERLKIPEQRLQDGPQGIGGGLTKVMTWPSAQTVVSSFDRSLVQRFAVAMASEQVKKGVTVQLAPMMNIARVPYAGRNFESLGEDTYLTSAMSRELIRGIQSQGILACAKHYALNNQEIDRTLQTSQVSEKALREVYLPHFKAAVEEEVGSFMCSYNRVNQTYACENEALNYILQNEWGYKGYIMSDWFATHSTVRSALAGLHQEMPDDQYFGASLAKAVSSGDVAAGVVQTMVTKILTPMAGLGQLDRGNPAGTPGVDTRSEELAALAHELAVNSAVLLRNDGSLLPLAASYTSMNITTSSPTNSNNNNNNSNNTNNNNNTTSTRCYAFIGKAADEPVVVGGGSGAVWYENVLSPLAAANKYLATKTNPYTIVYDSGASYESARAAAARCDVAVVFTSTFVTEGDDRHSLDLDTTQRSALAGALAGNAKVVLAHFGGMPVIIGDDLEPRIKSVFMFGFLGQAVGTAFTDLVFGVVAPSGRLPITIPRSYSQLPFNNASSYPGVDKVTTYSEDMYVGYKWFDKQQMRPLYPFGHGISYASASYSPINISRPSWYSSSSPAAGAVSPSALPSPYPSPSSSSPVRVDVPDSFTRTAVLCAEFNVTNSSPTYTLREVPQLYVTFPNPDQVCAMVMSCIILDCIAQCRYADLLCILFTVTIILPNGHCLLSTTISTYHRAAFKDSPRL